MKATGSFGKTKLYALNMKSPFVQKLIALERDLPIEETSPKKAMARATTRRQKP